jgi:hypothetical protein
MRAPTIPQELDHRDDDGQPYARDGTKNGNTHQTDDRQPELPTLNPINSNEVGDLDQTDSRGDHDRGQCGGRQVLQQIGSDQQQQRHSKRADDPCQLCSRSTGVRDELLLIGKP